MYLTEYSCKTCAKYKSCTTKKHPIKHQKTVCPGYRFAKSLAKKMQKDILATKGNIFVCGRRTPARHDFAKSLAGFYPKDRHLVSYVSIQSLLASCIIIPKSKEKRQMIWAFVYLQIISTVMADALMYCEQGEISRARLDALALSYGHPDIHSYDDLLGLVQVALMSWDDKILNLEIPEVLRATSFILEKICKNVLGGGKITLVIDEDDPLWRLSRMVINELLLRPSLEVKVFCDPEYKLNTKACLLTNRCVNIKDYDVIEIDGNYTG